MVGPSAGLTGGRILANSVTAASGSRNIPAIARYALAASLEPRSCQQLASLSDCAEGAAGNPYHETTSTNEVKRRIGSSRNSRASSSGCANHVAAYRIRNRADQMAWR